MNTPKKRTVDVEVLRMLVRLREDYQSMRKRVDNRIGKKKDGTAQKVERVFLPQHLEMFEAYSANNIGLEEELKKKLKKEIRKYPIYKAFLKDRKGVGAISAGWIIGWIDIHEASTVSKIWQYAGLNPSMVRGKKRIDHKQDKTYEIKETKTMIRGDQLTKGFVSPFNTRLRAALCGVLGDSLLKAGIRGEDVTQEEYDQLPDAYRRMYKPKGAKTARPQKVSGITVDGENYLKAKHRYNTDPAWKERRENEKGGKAHVHRAAIRWMIKQLLADLYAVWRELEGLPVREPYNEARRGFPHAA